VNRQLILITPLADGQPAGFLSFKSGGPFIETNLVKFLFCTHEIILLDKMTRIAQFERIERTVFKIIEVIISKM
jgi:hypothetical protein